MLPPLLAFLLAFLLYFLPIVNVDTYVVKGSIQLSNLSKISFFKVPPLYAPVEPE
jgi:hypothetical protein